MHIGFLIYPYFTQIDVTGPAQVLSALRNAKIHMLWKTTDPVETDAGFSINPTTSFDRSPQLDVICIPGGPGQQAIMDDEAVLAFVKQQGAAAKYITSVCSGSLVLAKVGLLTGYRAGCHWSRIDELSEYGAIPVKQRVVHDRNRYTGGGATAGIDFGLTLLAEIAGEKFAKLVQLGLEYDPEPPFDCGSPERAGPELEKRVRQIFEQRRAEMMENV